MRMLFAMLMLTAGCAAEAIPPQPTQTTENEDDATIEAMPTPNRADAGAVTIQVMKLK